MADPDLAALTRRFIEDMRPRSAEAAADLSSLASDSLELAGLYSVWRPEDLMTGPQRQNGTHIPQDAVGAGDRRARSVDTHDCDDRSWSLLPDVAARGSRWTTWLGLLISWLVGDPLAASLGDVGLGWLLVAAFTVWNGWAL